MEWTEAKYQETGIVVIDKNRRIVYLNQWSQELLGDDHEQLFGAYLNCQLANQPKPTLAQAAICKTCLINQALKTVFATGKAVKLEKVAIKKHELDIHVTMQFSQIGDQILIEISNVNVKTFKIDFLMKLADKSKDIMFFKDESQRYLYANKTYANFLGTSVQYLIGKTDEQLVDLALLTRELYEQCLIGDRQTQETGAYYGMETMGDQHFRVSKEKIDGGILGVARNITAEVTAMQKAETDQLTQTNSRYKFEKDIKHLYETQEPYDLAIIDIDDLRNLNNTYGHLKGDAYLKAIGLIFVTQPQGQFYRVGGDEFIALIPSKHASAKVVFQQILAEIKQLDLDPPLSISAAVGAFDFSKSYDTNYEYVDQHLYKAKKNGKNQVMIIE
ncbi:MAG: diguanylate cyclase domain-containing protein [Culicoidibacterales bacterium]